MRVHKLKNLPRSGKQLNINQNAFRCSQPSTCFEGITPLELVHLQVRLVIALPNSYIVGERIRALLTCTALVAAHQRVNIKLTPCNVLNASLQICPHPLPHFALSAFTHSPLFAFAQLTLTTAQIAKARPWCLLDFEAGSMCCSTWVERSTDMKEYQEIS